MAFSGGGVEYIALTATYTYIGNKFTSKTTTSPVGPPLLRNQNYGKPDGYSIDAFGPIDSVVCNKAHEIESQFVTRGNYQRNKPIYVKAIIKKNDTINLENPDANPGLKEVIRDRGMRNRFGSLQGNNDFDCGHIVARSLGGRMADFNLIPMARHINQGSRGYYQVWKAAEDAIHAYLRANGVSNPNVIFEMECVYGDDFPDRPVQFTYNIAMADDNMQNAVILRRLLNELQRYMDNELNVGAEVNKLRIEKAQIERLKPERRFCGGSPYKSQEDIAIEMESRSIDAAIDFLEKLPN